MAGEKTGGKGERPRGPSEYAQKEGSRPRRRAKTRFVFKFAALILFPIVVLAAWIGWRIHRSGGNPLDLLDEHKRTALLTDEYRKAVDASAEARRWAEKEFKDWEKVLSKRLKSPPPKTKEESAALVKETRKEIEKPAPPVEKVATDKPKINPSLSKAGDEYDKGMKAYAMTDPDASQAQVQKYLRLAAGHFEVCLFCLDKARAEGVAENLIERYGQPAARRLYDCRKRMELQLGR